MASTAIYTVNVELALHYLHIVITSCYSNDIYHPDDDVFVVEGLYTLHHYRRQVRMCCNNCFRAVYVFSVILNCRGHLCVVTITCMHASVPAVTHEYMVHTCANTFSDTQARKCDRFYMNIKTAYCTFIACLSLVDFILHFYVPVYFLYSSLFFIAMPVYYYVCILARNIQLLAVSLILL